MSDDRYRIFKHSGRDFKYTFEPAKKENAPLVVILHGHSKSPASSKYRSENWNVLCPVDNFGHNGYGSWFLGEDGDFFWLDAMPALIRHVYSGNNIYFCGSSMGGFASILYGCMVRARAVYANIPQTKLLGSTYSESGMKVFFEPIFGEDVTSKFNDLRNVLEDDLPTSFILSGLRWDKPKYIEEQTLPFQAALCEHGINFRSEIQFGEGHALTHSIAQSIGFFDIYSEEINANYEKKSAGMKLRRAEGAGRLPAASRLMTSLRRKLRN